MGKPRGQRNPKAVRRSEARARRAAQTSDEAVVRFLHYVGRSYVGVTEPCRCANCVVAAGVRERP